MSDAPVEPSPRTRRIHAGLALALMLVGALQATNGTRGADFWEHAAVIRELAAHPLSPGHPELDLPTRVPLFTPYHLALALVSRATGLQPVTILELAGLGSLGLLSLAMWLFARWWGRNATAGPFLLLFSLFLWGPGPWRWSGFIHFDLVGMTAAYPSVLALALSILGLAAAARYVDTGRGLVGAAVGLLGALIILIHPFTVAVLWIGAAALAWQSLRETPRRSILLAGAIVLGTVVAAGWPYFSLPALIGEAARTYDPLHRAMYDHFWARSLPILAALPLLAGRLRRDPRDPTAVSFAVMAGLIFAGYASGRYSFGRLLPGAIFMAHFALADWTSRDAVPRLAAFARRSPVRLALAGLGGLTLASAAAANFADAWAFCVPRGADPAAPYAFLRTVVGPQDVILSDPKTSAIVPALAGRVVAVNNALPFVEDAEARRADVATFLAPGADGDVRIRILKTYRVRWVLLDRSVHGVASDLEPWLRARGRAVHEDSRFVLFDVHEVSEV